MLSVSTGHLKVFFPKMNIYMITHMVKYYKTK